MATNSLLRVCSASIGDGRQLCRNRCISQDTLQVVFRYDIMNSSLTEFLPSSWRWVPPASVSHATGSRVNPLHSGGTMRRVLYGMADTRSGERRGRCTGAFNAGPDTGANKVKGEGRVDTKEGEEEELVVRLSEMGKFWQEDQEKKFREAHDNGALSMESREGTDFSKFPSDGTESEEGRPEELQQSSENGRSVSGEVSQSASSTSSTISNSRPYGHTYIQGSLSGSGNAPLQEPRSDYRPQSSSEPVFLEVIPEDLATILPDPSQTVGLFDGQQPLSVIEQAQREADVEPVKEWDRWPTGLQESQIKIKTDLQGKYGREMAAAIQAVQLACMLSQRVQERLLRKEEKAGSKKDKSLITVADWGVQAVVSWVLSQSFQGEAIPMVAEEDTKGLRGQSGIDMSQRVVNAVNECLCEASVVGIAPPKQPLGSYEVLKLINKGTTLGGPTGRHWVLDPVDGTLGFVRGDQYAVALALVDDGEVVLGVLGCPNFPMRPAWLGYHHKYYRMAMKIVPPDSNHWHRGCVMTAQKGEGRAWMQPMIFNGETFNEFHAPREVCVSSVVDPTEATFCEPVEKANSSHSFTAGLADTLGLRNQPLRVYSMAKYAAIARGDAEIFMKFAKAGYKEKIWDHAAGVLIVQEAGGVVTDAGGRPLDFSKGRFLEGLDRGIIACCGKSLHNKIIAAVDASYNSSTL
ncbi:3',5'-bisphosphate nucleotidase AHL isoform X2 [Physcomitrium patens]|uniref:3',5'-bisphosphate nucleotidase AHL isoform X2 n=1 Tax=Physcomitrium patens TaxID=3218 RepID=UPI000D16B0F2|nr:PAP-specific phosphatase HAL2-like isoform X2 [Physcomitrium patens]|eukprot:XP_024392654.1 PAP-specific phosphatase HAL2-like isoform X2 [Physcomitrella patens]